jgi:alpha-N-arabinofuranosidase
VKIACLAQLINVIAPIQTDPIHGAWRQPTYYPFLHASKYGRGTAIKANITAPKFDCNLRTDVDSLDSVAVRDEEKGETTVFILNRNLDLDIKTTITVCGANKLLEFIQLAGFDHKSVNGFGNETVCPKSVECEEMNGELIEIIIPKASWNVLRFGG